VNVQHGDEAEKTKNGKMGLPTWRTKCRSGFTTLPPVPLLEQYHCGSFVGGVRSHEELAIREHSGHEDLRGSGHRSVIPYVHG
jgi:hypothetical protein